MVGAGSPSALTMTKPHENTVDAVRTAASPVALLRDARSDT